MAKFTLEDLAKAADPKEEARALSTFQDPLLKLYLQLKEQNPKFRKGEGMNDQEAEKLAKDTLKTALVEYMKEYQGNDNPQFKDIESMTLGLFGLNSLKLKQELVNKPLIPDLVASIGKQLTKRIMQLHQAEPVEKLNDELNNPTSTFRNDFGNYLVSKGIKLADTKLNRVTTEEVFELYGASISLKEQLKQKYGSDITFLEPSNK